MTYASNITQNYLNECFFYNEKTGDLIKKSRPLSHFKSESLMKSWNAQNAGKKAGGVKKNPDGYKYISVSVDNKNYIASHIIWVLKTGKYPEVTIDHKDRNSLNNSWENLRLANHSNQANNRKGKKNWKGVFKQKGRYRSRIKVNKKNISLGIFDCPAAASFAYQIAADIHFGEFARAF